MELIEKRINYTFKNKKLLQIALTHSSKTNEDKSKENNERLEFLGDAVLDLCIGAYLYKKLPNKKEGDLTKLRAMIVCADSLYLSSNKIELGEYILLGKGEINSRGKYKKNIIADAFEAVIGAIYLDSGYEKAGEIAISLLQDIIDKALDGKLTYDYKTILQEYVHANNITNFEYKLLKITGPEHAQEFTSEVLLDNKSVGIGTGHNKKESEQNAALKALGKLNLI